MWWTYDGVTVCNARRPSSFPTIQETDVPLYISRCPHTAPPDHTSTSPAHVLLEVIYQKSLFFPTQPSDTLNALKPEGS